MRDFDASLDDYPAALISTALHALALDPTLYARYSEADGLLFTPQKIGTDAALCEVLALFERRGLAAQYRLHGCSARLRSGCRDCRNCWHWRRKQRKRMKGWDLRKRRIQ